MDNIHVGNKKEGSKTSEGVKVDRRRTTPECPFEETVIGIVGDTPIDGIPGGLDLGQEPEEPPTHEAESTGSSHSGSSYPGKCKKCVDVFIMSANNDIYLVFTVVLFLQFLMMTM